MGCNSLYAAFPDGLVLLKLKDSYYQTNQTRRSLIFNNSNSYQLLKHLPPPQYMEMKSKIGFWSSDCYVATAIYSYTMNWFIQQTFNFWYSGFSVKSCRMKNWFMRRWVGWGVRTAVLAAIQFNATRHLCSVLGGISKKPAPAYKKPIVSREDRYTENHHTSAWAEDNTRHRGVIKCRGLGEVREVSLEKLAFEGSVKSLPERKGDEGIDSGTQGNGS